MNDPDIEYLKKQILENEKLIKEILALLKDKTVKDKK